MACTIDRAVAVALVVLVKLHPALEVDGVDHAAVLDHGLDIHADHVLADRQPGAGQRGADGEAFPVVLGHVGGADTGDDPRIAKPDAVIVTETHLEVHLGEDGLVAVSLDAVRADHGAHDVEVGIVDGVSLLRCRGYHAKRLRVDDLVAAIRRLAYLAHADTPIDAGHTHARHVLNESAVLFLVSVAAERITVESDISCTPCLRGTTCGEVRRQHTGDM